MGLEHEHQVCINPSRQNNAPNFCQRPDALQHIRINAREIPGYQAAYDEIQRNGYTWPLDSIKEMFRIERIDLESYGEVSRVFEEIGSLWDGDGWLPIENNNGFDAMHKRYYYRSVGDFDLSSIMLYPSFLPPRAPIILLANGNILREWTSAQQLGTEY